MTSSYLSTHEQRLMALRIKRQHLENLSGEEALEMLLSDPESLPLVHSFPEEDFFLLMHRIGPDDFAPVLAMASDKQWHFILDQECWVRDLPAYGAMGIWFMRFFLAAPRRFVQFLLEEEGDLMDAWLFRNVEVRLREHDEDPSDFGDGFSTMDDVLYFRMRPLAVDTDYRPEEKDAREEALGVFFRHLADISHPLFFRVLQEMAWSIPAELEESSLRWRRVRMAEKGFIPKEEAVALFQPLGDGELETLGRKGRTRSSSDWKFAVPEQGLRMASSDVRFSEAVALMDSEEGLTELQLELADLCNRFIAAKGKVLRSREEIDAAGRMVMGYVRVGIGRITGQHEPDAGTVSTVLKQYRMDAVFRAGFGPVMRLKWKIEGWWEKAWFRRSGLSLSFWEEEGMGLLGGLLLDLPLRFDASLSTGSYYLPFASDTEIAEGEEAVDDIMALDDVLALLGLREVDSMGRLLTWKNLLLTLWANDSLGDDREQGKLIPLHEERFRLFLKGISMGKGGGGSPGMDRKNNFLAWLAGRTGLDAAALADRIGPALETLFGELEGEMGQMNPADLDCRYIELFLLRPA
ncbi:DUF6178 family protein [Desulfobotulus sp. H1]|uniref:DUF6178 family protein n=1 Tax=Desulfobotulus pelophilus TaxID=2823377 RepID=A0ABT3NAM8_9BACT|nr:DUF6178 family protein [Desulfobotulus pelophilus]MCW7754520.1 DUF6178 family protein [Desulfobotulus pelophilus]